MNLVTFAQGWLKEFPQLFQKDAKILVACSAGLDSTVLCHLLKEIMEERHKKNLAIAHVNFRLRKVESDKDQLFCQDLARRLNLCYFGQLLPPQAHAARLRGESIQQWARGVRQKFFHLMATEGWTVALGHHEDDWVETILLRLARGSAPGALQGMCPYRKPFWRPLLSVSRLELEAYARQHSLAYRTDASNAERIYRRNVLRHDVIPVFREFFPGFSKNLIRHATRLQTMSQWISEHHGSLITAMASKKGCPIEELVELEESIFAHCLLEALGRPRPQGRRQISHTFFHQVHTALKEAWYARQSSGQTNRRRWVFKVAAWPFNVEIDGHRLRCVEVGPHTLGKAGKLVDTRSTAILRGKQRSTRPGSEEKT